MTSREKSAFEERVSFERHEGIMSRLARGFSSAELRRLADYWERRGRSEYQAITARVYRKELARREEE